MEQSQQLVKDGAVSTIGGAAVLAEPVGPGRLTKTAPEASMKCATEVSDIPHHRPRGKSATSESPAQRSTQYNVLPGAQVAPGKPAGKCGWCFDGYVERYGPNCPGPTGENGCKTGQWASGCPVKKPCVFCDGTGAEK